MGMTWRNHANGCVVGVLPMCSFLFILINLLHLLNVGSLHQPPPTMAITTRSNKEKPISQATVATVATPVIHHPNQRAKHLARSPHTFSINIHLANINRPKTRINSVLQALQPNRYAALEDPNANSDAPGYLSPPIKKSILLASPDLPTGVDVQDGAPQATAHNVSPQGSNTL
jgi:hypothetical protein